MRIRIITFCALAAAAAARGPVVAQANAAFAGQWRIDLERSSSPPQLPFPVLDHRMMVALDGDNVAVTLTFSGAQGERQVQYTIVTDGKPHELPAFGGRTRSVRARWKKDRLTLSYTLAGGPLELDVAETWRIKESALELQYAVRMQDRSIVRTDLFVREGDAATAPTDSGR